MAEEYTHNMSQEKGSLPADMVGLCIWASFLLAFTESLLNILKGQNIPWDAALGIYAVELGLGIICIGIATLGAFVIARLLRLQIFDFMARIVCLAFPVLFGLCWTLEIDTPETRFSNLLSYCLISGVLSIVWMFLGIKSKSQINRIGLPTLLFWFLFSILSMACFSFFLYFGIHYKYFPVFYGLYAILFLVAGNVAFVREGQTKSGEGRPLKMYHGLASIVLATVLLTFFAYVKSAHLDSRPAYASPKDREISKDGPNVILISLDTLRADHLSCYGYDRKTSPNIDKLARQGVKFEHAISQAPWTLPSHTSLFTSLYPYQLQKHEIGNHTSLTDILHAEGYTTVAFTGGHFLSNRIFGRGFDFLDDESERLYYLGQSQCLLNSALHLRRFGRRFGISARPLNVFNHWRFWGPNRTVAHGSFARQRENTTAWIEEHGHKNKFFLFLHTYSIHDYFLNRKRARMNAKIFNPDYSGMFDGNNLDSNSEYPEGRHDVEQIVALYDGEILDADKEMGILIDELVKSGLFENTLIVLLSDHGEGFDVELNRLWHRHRLNEDLLRVPLIMTYPNAIPPEKTAYSQVALIDVMPTILDFLDIEYPRNIEGMSLKSRILDDTQDQKPRNVYSEVASFEEFGVSVRTDPLKYIKYPNRVELYDIVVDPQERVNLADTAGDEIAPLRLLAESFFTRTKQEMKYDSDTIDQMKAIGYLQ